MKKSVLILTVVLSAICATGVWLLNRYYGTDAMILAIVVMLAVSNLIIAIAHEKTSKKVKSLEQKLEELTQK